MIMLLEDYRNERLKKLEEVGNYENKEGIARCLYIDDHIYGLEDSNDKIVSWMIKGDDGK